MFFIFSDNDPQADDLRLLDSLMERWESEIVEFKEATGQYSADKMGQYFSAISNEANLKNKRYGWIVLGVSEKPNVHLVGTSFKNGNHALLEKFKYEISMGTTDGITFSDIIELHPATNEKTFRVLMFQVPAAAVGIPTEWNNRCYARSGDSLVPLNQQKIDAIRSQERLDWSKQIVPGARIEHLDRKAIELARDKYKKKMNQPHISEEVDEMTDEQFLTKVKLLINGNVTNAAMVLLGNPDYDNLMERPPSIMWRLYTSEEEIKDYCVFTIPFLLVVDQVFEKLRNLTYRYMPNQLSLFPTETQQYDPWMLRELLNNSIAHSNYQLGGRIYINEFDDSISISNPGDFLPRSVETVLQAAYNPPFYRNQLLADSMVKFYMIDTATSGIKRVYRIQKKKFFPMPDYTLSSTQVSVLVYGKVIDEKYTHILYYHPDLDLETAYLLDQVQKGNGRILSKEAVAHLRRHGLVEGRVTNLFLSAEVAQSIAGEADYIKNKGFDDSHYRELIVSYLTKFGKANRKQITELLWEKLPNSLTDDQKRTKITTLLTHLRKKRIIETDTDNHQKSFWRLAKKR